MSGNWSVVVVGIGNDLMPVKVATNRDDFLKTTVKQLKQKIYNVRNEIEPDKMRLIFAGKQMNDFKEDKIQEATLEYYNIQNKSTVQVVVRMVGGTERVPLPPEAENKKHRNNDPSVRLTDEHDVIMGYSDPSDPRRVKMSCGHAVDPSVLTNYCRSKLKENIFKFTCPAIVDTASNKACGKEWAYSDIRKAALLTEDEMKYFEYKISANAAKSFIDMKECPGCRTYIERIDLYNLRVTCSVCTKKKGRTWDFCWYCLKEWSGPSRSSEKCGNPSCKHPELLAIEKAPIVTLNGKQIPNLRACPTCGKVVEHTLEKCKMVICPRCQKEFCFLCLLLSVDCLKSAPMSWFQECKNPPAQRQTSIPVWSRSI